MKNKVVVALNDLIALINLAKELAKEVRTLEGIAPSSQDADRYIAQCIAKVEKILP